VRILRERQDGRHGTGKTLSVRRLLLVPTAVICSIAGAADRQTENNVIASAEDAFGLALGAESLGLYSDSSLRGFSPLTAGNARMDGLYFDKQGPMTARLVNDTRIRVGLSALDFPWPAPTGIVDYALRGPDDSQGLTSVFYAGPFNVRGVDLDGYAPLPHDVGGIAAGAAYRDDAIVSGETRRIVGYGLIPHWNASKDLTVRAFWGRRDVTRATTMPSIYVADGQAPPRIEPRYFGQSWDQGESYAQHYGVIVNANFPGEWLFRAGIFRSESDAARSYADLYLNTRSDGAADHVLVAEPDQRTGSTSGEMRVSRSFGVGRLKQSLVLGVRGRDVGAAYGGSAAVELGMAQAGQSQPVAPPDFVFGSLTRDHIHEWSAGVSYNVTWQQRGEITLGLQLPSYSRKIEDPTLGISHTHDDPRLYNASVAFFPLTRLVVYGAVTRGLEDSGVAPANSINRGQILGAARTSQEEGGLRYAPTSRLKLVAAVFQVQKPYFNLDTRNAFVNIGQERHRGLELSAAGEVLPGLSVVAGALFMSPTVIANAAQLVHTGDHPVGQTNRLAQLNLDYRPVGYPAVSFDCTFLNQGSQPASLDNRINVPAVNTLELGFRYRFNIVHYAAMLRAQVVNVTNAVSWYVASDGGLQPLEPRRGLAYLTVDL
jgi:iron complex outermembrane receptor protein